MAVGAMALGLPTPLIIGGLISFAYALQYS